MSSRWRLLIFALLAIGSLFSAAALRAQDANEIDTSWPREFQVEIGKVIIYQPQIDTLVGNVITGRAALSVQGPKATAPVFGALWFQCDVSVDRDAGLVTLEDTKITRVRFPDATAEQMDNYKDVIGKETNTWDIVLTLEQVETSLAASQKEVASTENLKSDPPIILFSQTPAVLVSFDGEPETRPIKDSPYERVVNTAFLIIKDKTSGSFYLSNGQTWYAAKNPKGPWAVTKNPPAAIKDFVKPDPDAEPETGPPPQIITATQPTELIVTSGAPNWTALTGNEMLYVSNTESTWIKEIATNKNYLLLSGRWFSSQSLDGPWTYERGDQLPASFRKIAPASPIGDALTAVAGTNEADDAEADAEIPQTAAIKRDEAKVDVTYDGAPQFQPIPTTQIQYAVNTGSSVLRIGDRYYVCDNGVWFIGLTPNGPWAVADSVPDSIQSIPPSSPVYNVRYVHIYEATPTIVYVGYTPGYLGTYRYYGTVVYGTGWYYRPWIGPVYYYPRPYTWGFNVIYNPWNGGWGFALGYSTPFINVSIGWSRAYYRYPPYYYGGGWWGPGGYRPIYRPLPGYRPPYRPPKNVVVIQPIGPGRPRPGHPGSGPGRPGRPGARPTPYARDNIYARPGTADRVAKDYRPKGKTPRPATKTPNNVYTDKNGNVYRRGTGGKWEKRDDGKWTRPAPTTPETRPSKPGTRPAPDKPETQPAKPGTRPGTKPAPGAPETQPTKPGTRPGTKPAPGAPETQPTKPGTRPGTKPAPGAPPSTRPGTKPEQPGTAPSQPPSQPPSKPSTRPARPAPAKPATPPSNPTIQPAPNNPPARPSNPSAPPAPKPSNPPSAQPSIQPAPAPGLDRDAAARDRSRPPARSAPPSRNTPPPQRPNQSNNSGRSGSGGSGGSRQSGSSGSNARGSSGGSGKQPRPQ